MTNKSETEKLLDKCKSLGIETTLYNSSYSDKSWHYISMPNGEAKKRISVHSDENAAQLLSIEFEKFSFLKDYDAIVDLETGEIEAAITSRTPVEFFRFERLLGFSSGFAGDDPDTDDSEDFCLRIENPDGVKIEFSKESLRLKTIVGGPRRGMNANSISLKIFLNKTQTYDTALSALEVISNALFFQIEIENNFSLMIRKARRRRIVESSTANEEGLKGLQFPAYEYDSAPISLYWYAKSARAMPLLQFLAFYQVAEYYFPNFAKLEAIRSTRKILKHPSFRVDRESDLTKLISSIAGNGRVVSSEREQIKATISEVLTVDDVNQYLKERKSVAEFVSKKQKGITDKTININRKDHDHRPEIAELLYDIRCRIVHTKNDFENFRSEMLLPYSIGEEGLWAYIDLMQLVARHALIRSSSIMRSF